VSAPLESLGKLETQLELFIENVRQIGIMVSDVQPQGQTVLNQKLNGLIAGLQEIDKLRSQVEDVYVPLEVCFSYIDKNKNPQLYTKDVMVKTRAKNEEVKGKIEGFQKFKSSLLVELFKTFPAEMESYRAYRNDWE
ncbi:hypothetical protein KR054_008290, partial [Drosophila jambulina]